MFPRNFEKHLKSDLKKKEKKEELKHAQSLVWPLNCVCGILQIRRYFQPLDIRSFFFVSGFIVATFCALLLNISLSVQQGCNATVENECPSARFDPTPKQSIVARALNIWIVVSHIIISSAGYKGNMTELQETNKLNNNNNNNDKPQSWPFRLRTRMLGWKQHGKELT